MKREDVGDLNIGKFLNFLNYPHPNRTILRFVKSRVNYITNTELETKKQTLRTYDREFQLVPNLVYQPLRGRPL